MSPFPDILLVWTYHKCTHVVSVLFGSMDYIGFGEWYMWLSSSG